MHFPRIHCDIFGNVESFDILNRTELRNRSMESIELNRLICTLQKNLYQLNEVNISRRSSTCQLPVLWPQWGPVWRRGLPSWRCLGSGWSRRPSPAPPVASCCSWLVHDAASLASVHLESTAQAPITQSPTDGNKLMALDWIISAAIIRPTLTLLDNWLLVTSC